MAIVNVRAGVVLAVTTSPQTGCKTVGKIYLTNLVIGRYSHANQITDHCTVIEQTKPKSSYTIYM